jgi:NDP-sugar pyrophosphorylase family protein
MKALILAAGKGTRLLPLTKDRPKVMIEFGDKPLLWYHIRLLKFYGITDIWMNTNWYPQSIYDYFGDGSKFGVHLIYSEEKELLGTAGALNPLKRVFKDDQFLITQGDNLTNFNYSKLIKFHNQHHAFFSLGLFNSPEPWTQGMVETDKSGSITKLVEKPDKKDVTTDQVNAGVYVCEPGLLKLIPPGFCDFGFDVFPEIIRKKLPFYGLSTGDYVQDTGTHERLKKAKADLPSLKFPFKI